MENWDDYRFFLAGLRTGSASSAAETLGTNHTTVSRRVSALEARLGVRLFDRMRSGYLPTIAAIELAPVAEQMQASAHKMSRLSGARDSRLEGSLMVTAPSVLLHYLLMPVVTHFSRAYPGIELELEGSDRVSNLVNREADVAIRVTAAPQETLIGNRLASNVNVICASPRYLESRSLSPATAIERDDLDWIAVKGDGSRWQTRLFPNGRSVCCVDSKLAAISAALAGMGIIELPALIANAEPRLVRLGNGESKSDRDIWVLYHRDLRQTARVTAFVSELRRHFKQLPA